MVDLKATETDCCSCGCRSICVLSAVEPEVLASSASRVQWVPFERGVTIVQEGDSFYRLGHPLSRTSQAHRERRGGKRLLLRFCGPGELLAGSLSGPHGCSVTAASRCFVGFVPREHVLDLGRRYPELLAGAHLRWEERERLLARPLVDRAYASTRKRLVQVLLNLGEEHGVREGAKMRIDLPLSLGDLAEMIGASRQATCTELQLLRAKGVIEVVWPRVVLSDDVERLRPLS